MIPKLKIISGQTTSFSTLIVDKKVVKMSIFFLANNFFQMMDYNDFSKILVLIGCKQSNPPLILLFDFLANWSKNQFQLFGTSKGSAVVFTQNAAKNCGHQRKRQILRIQELDRKFCPHGVFDYCPCLRSKERVSQMTAMASCQSKGLQRQFWRSF